MSNVLSSAPEGTNTCPFCANIQNNEFFTCSNSFAAIYNLAPILPGHSLIIPRQHIVSVSELSNEELSELFIFTRNVTDKLVAFYDGIAFDWSLQDGIAAGQTIPHLHIHIVPRKQNDLGDKNDWYQLARDSNAVHLDSFHRNRLVAEEYLEITNTLKKYFSQKIVR